MTQGYQFLHTVTNLIILKYIFCLFLTTLTLKDVSIFNILSRGDILNKIFYNVRAHFKKNMLPVLPHQNFNILKKELRSVIFKFYLFPEYLKN
jgi:hypothetical protein